MSENIASIGEFGLITFINKIIEKEGIKNPGLTLGIGDDAASFVPGADCEIIVTCDSMVEERHYLSAHITAYDLGSRAMVMNISDIGAMGGLPFYALISLGLRQDTPLSYVEGMYRGFIDELNPFNASLIGGNITRSDHLNFIDITLIGEVSKGSLIRRSTARPGDLIFVTGYPGQAAAGLSMLLQGDITKATYEHPLVRAYNRPAHRAREGRAIAESGFATSMIDLSDGFLGDLGHVCEESLVGARIVQNNMPLSPSLRAIEIAEKKSIYDIVLNDSDDYELIITCDPSDRENIISVIKSISTLPFTEVGRITDDVGRIEVIMPDGSRKKLTPSGWDHFKSNAENSRLKAQSPP